MNASGIIIWARVAQMTSRNVRAQQDEYVLFHSPSNGVGIKRSADLATWTDGPLLTLGQAE